jgi:hypothetical protein
MATKVNLEMDLADVLRISVLLDHHRGEAANHAERGNDASSAGLLYSNWGAEAADLNSKLLKAVAVTARRPR